MRTNRAALLLVAGAVSVGLVASSGSAVAAPASAYVASSQATVPESTATDKIRAAAALGITADASLLGMSDKDVVITLWRQAQGHPEVRASAELAFADSAAACTGWIKQGIFEAKERDDRKEVRDEEIARVNREAKTNALITAGIVVTPERAILGNKDFVYQVWQLAEGKRVKDAALTAFGGTDEQQWAFITTGLLSAHQQDQQDAIDAAHDADEAEKARLAARDAKRNAAAVVGQQATEQVLVLSDENFVRWTYNTVQATNPGGTHDEVVKAALDALTSDDATAWKDFITTGIYAADKRDLTNQLAKIAKANRDRLTQLQQQSVNDGMHLLIARNAKRALAQGDKAIRDYLYGGIDHDHVLSLRTTSPGFASAYVDNTEGSSVATVRGADAYAGAGGQLTWGLVPGLGNPGCYSFESRVAPGQYLWAGADNRTSVRTFDGSDDFAKHASWCAINRASGVALELQAEPGRFLRHYGGTLYSAANGGPDPYDATKLFTEDTTWKVDWPDPLTKTPIDLRYSNDDDVHAALGTPQGDEQSDGTVRFENFSGPSGKTRMVWTPGTGANIVRGSILDKYLELGGHRSFGAPTTDEIALSTGGAVSHFDTGGTGGSIYAKQGAGVWPVMGAIWQRYMQLGADRSYLGYPVTGEVRGTIIVQRYEHGRIECDTRSGAVKDYHG